MYVRWKPRRRKAGYNRGCLFLTAVLLESRRVDGQPRQKYIAGLGTLRVQHQHLPKWDSQDLVEVHGGFTSIGDVIWFWHDLTECLDGLELSPKQRQVIESQVGSRIPKPTDAQHLAYGEWMKRLLKRMEDLTG